MCHKESNRLRLDGGWSFAERHEVRFAAFGLNRSKTRVIDVNRKESASIGLSAPVIGLRGFNGNLNWTYDGPMLFYSVSF